MSSSHCRTRFMAQVHSAGKDRPRGAAEACPSDGRRTSAQQGLGWGSTAGLPTPTAASTRGESWAAPTHLPRAMRCGSPSAGAVAQSLQLRLRSCMPARVGEKQADSTSDRKSSEPEPPATPLPADETVRARAPEGPRGPVCSMSAWTALRAGSALCHAQSCRNAGPLGTGGWASKRGERLGGGFSSPGSEAV